jgi:outer membrane protein
MNGRSRGDNRGIRQIAARVIITLVLLFLPAPGLFAMTLEDAVKRAIGLSYTIKEQNEIVRRSEFAYSSTIDPYLPKVDLRGTYSRTLYSSGGSAAFLPGLQLSDQLPGALNTYTFTGSLTYRLFDGGERSARRRGSYSLLEKERERVKTVRQDVLFDVKNAFYDALGRKLIIEKRTEALDINRRILGLTQGRYEEGVARKSDVLQAEVRFSTSRIDLLEAKKEYEKSGEALKSILFLEPGSVEEAEGELEEPHLAATDRELADRALRLKPEVLIQTKEVERLEQVSLERRSAWYPRIDAGLQQTRQDSRFLPSGREDAFIINVTFPLFDGVGRYTNVKAALSDVSAAKQRLEEIKRTVRLSVIQSFKDYELSVENVHLYRELLREATTNFDQAFGEYRVGKGDILALLQTERDLARAKENLITSLYKAHVALANLQRIASIGGE